MKNKTYNNLADIPKLKYEGYIWLSDKEIPTVLNNKKFDFNSIGENPFIIEALLYCKETNVSVMIKHTGKYIINEYNLHEWRGSGIVEEKKEYLAHRIANVNKLKFSQFWVEEPDDLCGEMEVLKLKATIFTGFKTKI